MKRILIILCILLTFMLGAGVSYLYFNKSNIKQVVQTVPKTVTKKDVPIKIDKSNFDTFSKTLLSAINQAYKNETGLDYLTDEDLHEYLNSYRGSNYFTSQNQMDTKEKDICDDVFLTSINLRNLIQSKEKHDNKNIQIQKNILSYLFSKYKF